MLPGSRVRFDALLGEWVGIAGPPADPHLPPAGRCLPAVPVDAVEPERDPLPHYDVVVFENRFPSFAGAGPEMFEGGLFDSRPGTGRCEVVCFTSDHHALLSTLPPSRMRTVIEAWADRTAALSAHAGVEQVFCFENRGVEIGVTLAHPHGQIYGYPFVTPKTAAADPFDAAVPGSAPAATLFGRPAGRRDRRRLPHRQRRTSTGWPSSRSPPAGRSRCTCIREARSATSPQLGDAERDALAELYLDVIRRMEGVFDDTLPAITGVHQAPVHADGRGLLVAPGGVLHPSGSGQDQIPGRV